MSEETSFSRRAEATHKLLDVLSELWLERRADEVRARMVQEFRWRARLKLAIHKNSEQRLTDLLEELRAAGELDGLDGVEDTLTSPA